MIRPLPPLAIAPGDTPTTHLAPYLATSDVAPCGDRIRGAWGSLRGDSFSTCGDHITCRRCLQLMAREEARTMKRTKAKDIADEPRLAVGDTVALREADARVFRTAELYADLKRDEPMQLDRMENRGGTKIWYCRRADGRIVLARSGQLVRLTAKGRSRKGVAA